MEHIISLAKNSFKKNKKTLFSFCVILFIASMLFGSALTIGLNFSKNYDEKFNQLNTANVFFIIPRSECNDQLLKEINNINGIEEIDSRKGILLTVPVKTKNSVQDQNLIFYDIGDNSNISKYEVMQESDTKESSYILLSNYTYVNSALNINDNFDFTINNREYSYPVKGIIEEMQYGNYSSQILSQFLSNDAYDNMLTSNEENEVISLNIKSNNSYETYNDVSKLLNKNNVTICNRNYDQQSKNSRLAIVNVLVLILSLFSFVILFVSLLVSKFKIEQSIEEEMTDMGVLKALGYTSKEIMISNALPYILSGFVFCLFGIAFSYTIVPMLKNVVEMQTGFNWSIKFDLLTSAIVLIIDMTLITIFTYLAVKKIKKLNPIDAIRDISKDKGSRNHFEIEKTKVGIQLNLALKNYSNCKKQNRLLGVVLFFITFVASFVGILFYNVNLNPANFIDTLVEEHPNVAMTVCKDIKESISQINDVKNVIYYDENCSITYNDNLYKVFVADSFNEVSNDICYDGKNPSNEDEIAVGSKIQEMYGIKLNDEIEIFKNGMSKKYKVVGFIQSVNNFGEVFELTLDGFKKIDSNYIPITLYVYLENGKNADDFINDIKNIYKDDIQATVNYDKSMISAMEMYVSLVSIVSFCIIIITILLIYLILYIIISGIITKRKRELGILKSMGYRNKELIFELIGGFMPSVIFSTTCGFILSKILMNDIYKNLFKTVGAYKISFSYPILVFLIIAIFIILSTIMLSYFLSKKIKKISVYSLIKE